MISSSRFSAPRHRSAHHVARAVAVTAGLCVAALAPALAATASPSVTPTSGPRVVDSIRVAGVPDGLAMNNRTGTLYVGNDDTYRVAVVDVAARKVVGHIGPFGCCALAPPLVAVNQGTNTMYAANFDDDDIYASRGRGPQYRGRPIPVVPESIAVNRRSNTVYLIGDYIPKLFALNGRTLRIEARIALPNHTYGPVAVDPATARVYVADGVDVDVINGRTEKVVDRIPSTGSADVAVDARTDTVYVSHPYDGDGSVTVIDSRTDTVTTTIPIAGSRALAVDGATGTLLVSGTDGVSVVDVDDNTVTATVPVPGEWTGDVAVDTRRNQAYVGFRHGVKVIAGLPS